MNCQSLGYNLANITLRPIHADVGRMRNKAWVIFQAFFDFRGKKIGTWLGARGGGCFATCFDELGREAIHFDEQGMGRIYYSITHGAQCSL